MHESAPVMCATQIYHFRLTRENMSRPYTAMCTRTLQIYRSMYEVINDENHVSVRGYYRIDIIVNFRTMRNTTVLHLIVGNEQFWIYT